MKLFILIIIFFSTVGICHAQVSSTFASNNTGRIVANPVFQKQKFSAYGLDSIAKPPGLRMMKVGRGFTIGGPILVIAGIITLTSFQGQDDTVYSGLGEFLGTIMIVGGAGMTTTGIILWSKGSKKYNQYLEKQGATTSLQWKGNRLSLTYRF